MTGAQETELFGRLASVPAFRVWLDEQRAEAVKVLAAGEGRVLHQAQGKYSLIDVMTNLLERGKSLR